MKRVYTVLGVVLALLLLAQGVALGVGGGGRSLAGEGTEESPLLVGTPAELTALRDNAEANGNYAGMVVRLVNSVDMAGQSWSAGMPFAGVFDGNGKSIVNLSTGLFSQLDGAEVRNLSVTANVSSSAGGKGILADAVRNSTIENCAAAGSISAGSAVGGIAGTLERSTVSACGVTGSVRGQDDVGGLAGTVQGGSVVSCYSVGTVSGGVRVGGLAGTLTSTAVSASYSGGDVAGADYVGGIAGEADQGVQVARCYASGSVTTNYYGGGLVGYAKGTATSRVGITDCYAGAAVAKSAATELEYSRLGGIAGYAAYADLTRCYAVGDIRGEWRYVAGIVPTAKDTTLSCCVALQQLGDGVDARIVQETEYCELRECYGWSGWTGRAGAENGIDAGAAQIQSAAFWQGLGFTGSGWTTQAGRLPVLTGLSGQSAAIPAYISPEDGGDAGGGAGTEPGTAEITILCLDGDGEQIAARSRTANPGERVTVEAPQLPGYTVIGTASRTVTVPEGGTTVSFTYAADGEGTEDPDGEEPDEEDPDEEDPDGEEPDEENPDENGEPEQTLPFTDVQRGQWFYDTVAYVYTNGLFAGTDAATFSPGTPMTRAMFVQAMANMAGVDERAYTGSSFSDVQTGKWYASVVSWAEETGVVTGYDDGTFRPDSQVSRQEMATMIARYAEYRGLTLAASGSPAEFRDSGRISGWAAEGVELMRRTGIIVGDDDGMFNPQDSTTRAEAATVFMRLHMAAGEAAGG